MRLEEVDVIGKRAFDLLSADALRRYILASAGRLRLTNAVARWTSNDPSPDLLLELNACFESANPAVTEAAEAIARRYGHYLGYLIAVLKRGDQVNRDARPEWYESYWQHWAGIQQVKLGGGLVSGCLGPRAVKYAMEVLAGAGVNECTISLAEYPAYLPMIGAARSAPSYAQAMAVFDFGGTYTKSGCAFYDSGTLKSLTWLPKERTQVSTYLRGMRERSLASFMSTTMTQVWTQVYRSALNPATTIVATLASYIKDGKIDPTQAGRYGELRYVSSNINTWFAKEVSDRLRRPIAVTFLHDGTAAARTYAGPDAQDIAVITLGTALGVGYPPSGEGLRPIAANFSVT